MSLIGTLEQFSLSTVLQRVERHEKTGLLILKNRDAQEIEFYLHEGRLLCIGPIRTKASLGKRLLRDGIISSVVLNETLLVLGDTDPAESLMARALMDLHYVSREELRAWAIQKAVDVLNVVLAWPSGDMYFEEDAPPPSERLLVSMSISSLLERATPVTPTPAPLSPRLAELPAQTPPPISQPLIPFSSGPSATPAPDVSNMPTLMSASQFVDDASFSTASLLDNFTEADSALPTTEPFAPLVDSNQLDAFPDGGIGADVAAFPSFFSDGDAIALTPTPAALHPVRVMQPEPPKHIDTGFMQPDMVLMPADFSAYRDQNPQVQLTPEQWQILVLVDGRNSLEMICQLSNKSGEYVRSLAGELIAEHLVYVTMPAAQQIQGVPVMPQELTAPGMASGYVAPGYASATSSPWSNSLPAVPSPPAVEQPIAPPFPAPTEAQWGNGENGAAFIPGQGWVMNPPQSMQNPFQGENSQYRAYAPAGTVY